MCPSVIISVSNLDVTCLLSNECWERVTRLGCVQVIQAMMLPRAKEIPVNVCFFNPLQSTNHVPLTSAIGPSSYYLHCHTLSLLICQVLMAQDITLAHNHSCRASKPCLRSSGLAPNPMMRRELWTASVTRHCRSLLVYNIQFENAPLFLFQPTRNTYQIGFVGCLRWSPSRSERLWEGAGGDQISQVEQRSCDFWPKAETLAMEWGLRS